MGCCVAYGCSNRPCRKKPGITFHRFPKNKDRRRAWRLAVRRKKWNPSNYSLLCSEHFTEDQFDRASQCVVRLKDHAVPSVFKFNASPLETGIKLAPRKVLTPCISGEPDTANCNLNFDKSNPISTIKIKEEEADEGTTSLNIPIEKTAIAINGESASLLFPQFFFASNESVDALQRTNHVVASGEQVLPSLPQLYLTTSVVPLGPPSIDYKKKLERSKEVNNKLRKKIRILQQTVRRCKKKLEDYNSVVEDLRYKSSIGDNLLNYLLIAAEKNTELS